MQKEKTVVGATIEKLYAWSSKTGCRKIAHLLPFDASEVGEDCSDARQLTQDDE